MWRLWYHQNQLCQTQHWAYCYWCNSLIGVWFLYILHFVSYCPIDLSALALNWNCTKLFHVALDKRKYILSLVLYSGIWNLPITSLSAVNFDDWVLCCKLTSMNYNMYGCAKIVQQVDFGEWEVCEMWQYEHPWVSQNDSHFYLGLTEWC